MLHETEAETGCDHITPNSKRPDRSSLQNVVNDRSSTAYLSFKRLKRLFSSFFIWKRNWDRMWERFTVCPKKKVSIKTFIMTCSLLQFTVFEFIWIPYI